MRYLTDIHVIDDREKQQKGKSVFKNYFDNNLWIYSNRFEQTPYALYVAIHIDLKNLGRICGYITKNEVSKLNTKDFEWGKSYYQKLSFLHPIKDLVNCNSIEIEMNSVLWEKAIKLFHVRKLKDKQNKYEANIIFEEFLRLNNVPYEVKKVHEENDFIIDVDKNFEILEEKTISPTIFNPFVPRLSNKEIEENKSKEKELEDIKDINLEELDQLYDKIVPPTQCWMCDKYIKQYRNKEKLESNEIWHLSVCLNTIYGLRQAKND